MTLNEQTLKEAAEAIERLSKDIPIAIKMKTAYWEKIQNSFVQMISSTSDNPIIGRGFNGLPVYIDDSLDKDYELVYRD